MYIKYFSFALFFAATSLINSCDDETTSSSEVAQDGNETSALSTAVKPVTSEIVDELGSNLKAGLVKMADLSATEIDGIKEAALKGVADAGLAESEDLTKLMPAIIKGAEKSIADQELGADVAADAVGLIGSSMVMSLKNREGFISEAAAGLSKMETMAQTISDSVIGGLDEAGISAAKLTGKTENALSNIVSQMTMALGEAGFDKTTLPGALKALTAGSVEGLGDMKALIEKETSLNVGDLVSSITQSATATLPKIQGLALTSSEITGLVDDVTAGATASLGDLGKEYSAMGVGDFKNAAKGITGGTTTGIASIEKNVSDFDSNDAIMSVNEAVKGAVGAVDDVDMEDVQFQLISGDSNTKMAEMKALVGDLTAGAIAEIDSFTGESFNKAAIEAMIQEATQGATAGLAGIKDSDFLKTDLDEMMKEITASATEALGSLDPAAMVALADMNDVQAMVGDVMAGAMKGLDEIKSTTDSAFSDINAEDFQGMVADATSGAMGAVDEAFASATETDYAAMAKAMTEKAVGHLDEIKGLSSDATLDADDIKGGIDDVVSGAMLGLGDLDMTGAQLVEGATGTEGEQYNEIVKEITEGSTAGLAHLEGVADFGKDDLSGMLGEITRTATLALDDLDIEGFDSNDLAKLLGGITEGATAGLGELKDGAIAEFDGLTAADLDDLVGDITFNTTSVLDDLKGIEGLDPNSYDDLMKELTAGATKGLGAIKDDLGMDANDIKQMVNKVTQGAVRAMGELDDLPADLQDEFLKSVTDGAAEALDEVGVTTSEINDLIGAVSSGAQEAVDTLVADGSVTDLQDANALTGAIESGLDDAIDGLDGITGSGSDFLD